MKLKKITRMVFWAVFFGFIGAILQTAKATIQTNEIIYGSIMGMVLGIVLAMLINTTESVKLNEPKKENNKSS